MREKLGASVFLGFGILILAIGIDGLLTKYDQGGFVTWGIVIIFGLIFSLAGVVLLLNTISAVPERVKQLLGHIMGGLVFLLFGVVGIFVDELGFMRVILIFLGAIGVLIVVQGIRLFMNKDAADKTSGVVWVSSEVGGDMEPIGYQSTDSTTETQGYSVYEAGQQGASYGKEADPSYQSYPQENEASGTPFSGPAVNKVYTSQMNNQTGGSYAGYGSGLSPEFNQAMKQAGWSEEQQQTAEKVGRVVKKGVNIYSGVICIVVGSILILINGIIVLSFIFTITRTAALGSVMSSLVSTIMSGVLLIIGVVMIVRGVNFLRGKM